MNENTMEIFKRTLDNAIYTFGHCLVGDIDATGLTEKLNRWLEMSTDLSMKLDDALYAINQSNKEEQ